MKHLGVITIACALSIYSCREKEIEYSQQDKIQETTELQNEETKLMVNRLQNLTKVVDPKVYLYSNQLKADFLYQELSKPNVPYHGQLWFEYCTQLLRAGQSRQCIQELESEFNRGQSLADQMNSQNYLLFDLLALAYLRTGEQENCQNSHNQYSCILPLDERAYHKLPEGSSRAIQLYQDMYDRSPNDSYLWLINLGYMTLGTYPTQVPKKYYIEYPNWKLERKEFPRFSEVAMNLNAAINGLSGGVCLDDFNNDGFVDIFVTDYEINGDSKLLINDGKGSFVDNTINAGLGGIVSGLNCIHADYDNDGNIDILVLRGAWLNENGNHPNSLLKNNGDGTFSDVTESSGILSLRPSQTAAWADYNRDGNLDLFIGNESDIRNPNSCEFYKNNGDGTFTEASNDCHLNEINEFVKGVTWGDINNDNWPDLFISCKGKNLLYKNNKGIFENIAEFAGVEEPDASFATWFWDVNNDGYQDLFVANYDLSLADEVASIFSQELQGKKNSISSLRLYINNGNETFSDRTQSYNLDKAIFAMGANFGDLDNDGYLDFYLGTGSPNFESVVPNRMFRNVNGKRFEEVTSAGGFGHIQKGHGIAFADIDRDGDQDIYAVMGGAFQGDAFTNILFENPGFGNHWITLKLEGTQTNRNAIGTRIELILDNGKKIYRTIGTGGSFGSSSLQAEIGLGKAKRISKLTVFWQNSEPQIFENVSINQKISLKEGSDNLQLINETYIPFKRGDGKHQHNH